MTAAPHDATILGFPARPETKITMVTPAMAARLLERNLRNRPLADSTVEKYRRDMVAGKWAFAGDPIRFDTDGNLIDGQHRLAALAHCPDEIALPMLIIHGLPSETQFVMDQGRKRTPGQQLALRGVKDYNMVAAGAKVYLTWQQGLLFRDTKLAANLITTAEIEAWVSENETLILGLGEYIGDIRRNDGPPSIAYCAAIAFHKIDSELSRAFFRGLAHGAGGEGHPITVLDKRLQRERHIKMAQRDYLSLFILAWNAWREDRTVQKFQRPRGGSWSIETFPEPK